MTITNALTGCYENLALASICKLLHVDSNRTRQGNVASHLKPAGLFFTRIKVVLSAIGGSSTPPFEKVEQAVPHFASSQNAGRGFIPRRIQHNFVIPVKTGIQKGQIGQQAVAQLLQEPIGLSQGSRVQTIWDRGAPAPPRCAHVVCGAGAPRSQERNTIQKPMGVSEYQLTQSLPANLKSSLPTIEEIELELGEDI